MIKVRFEFTDGHVVEDETTPDMLPRVGETLVDDDRGGTFVVDSVIRRITGGRIQRSATVKLEEYE